MSSEMNVGIHALELYFPKCYVEQSELEAYDGVSEGKYTKGLGQRQMAVCDVREDVNSLALTVTSSLLRKYAIDVKRIGRVEVGTESSVDKSKSVKSVLMRLFDGHYNMRGTDCVNACFGGTQALLNAVDWCESCSCKGRLALVVMADIAVYEPGPARCTGGAGAVAMLIGADAPIVMEPGAQAFSMHDMNDFFKPLTRQAGRYPVVQGETSVYSYMRGLEESYREYRNEVEDSALASYRQIFMHCPFTKLVTKAYALLRLVEEDCTTSALVNGDTCAKRSKLIADTFYGKANIGVMREQMQRSEEDFQRQVAPTLTFALRCGNMYTPSVSAALASALVQTSYNHNERLLFYSYGSGACACVFSMRIRCDSETTKEALNRIKATCREALERLDQRTKISPAEFTERLQHYEDYSDTFTTPVDKVHFFANTFYLEAIDSSYIRHYEQLTL